MEGQDLSVILEGEEPEERDHFTLGFEYYVQARDDRYALISRNNESQAQLFDLREDPGMRNDVSGAHPDIVEQMFEGYVLQDAGGGPLPNYQKPRPGREAAS